MSRAPFFVAGLFLCVLFAACGEDGPTSGVFVAEIVATGDESHGQIRVHHLETGDLLFESDEDIYAEIAWAPDGSALVALTAETDSQLVVFENPGFDASRNRFVGLLGDPKYSWAPNGSAIGVIEGIQLVLYEPDWTEIGRISLTGVRAEELEAPVWSPESDALATLVRGDVVVLELTGRTQTLGIDGATGANPEDDDLAIVRWDDEGLLVQVERDIERESGDAAVELWRASFASDLAWEPEALATGPDALRWRNENLAPADDAVAEVAELLGVEAGELDTDALGATVDGSGWWAAGDVGLAVVGDEVSGVVDGEGERVDVSVVVVAEE